MLNSQKLKAFTHIFAAYYAALLSSSFGLQPGPSGQLKLVHLHIINDPMLMRVKHHTQ